jgi:hypothetical protein
MSTGKALFASAAGWTVALVAGWILVVGPAGVGCGPVGGGGITETCDSQIFCAGHGVCNDSSGTEVCTCYTGYAGLACQDCDVGYLDNGTGVCVQVDQCTAECGARNRECVEVIAGDVVCGECLEGYYEADGQCLEACAAESHQGELVPLDLYVMLDRSSSMNDAGKWSAVVSALQGFVGSSDAAGIGVGLQFFPVDPTGTIPTDCADCGLYGPCVPGFNVCGGSLATDTSCDPADYDDAQVPIQVLPGVQTAIVNSLNAESAGGSATPSEPAMSGAVTYATAWAQAHPDHMTFIVFATDGEPTGCTTNTTAGTATLAQGAADGTPSVKTFVIGVGSELSSLNQIATAGGTGQAYLVDTGGNVTQQFIDALNEIRSSGACLFQIPQPDVGVVDFNLVNVNLVDPADPDHPETVFGVGTEAGCDPSTGGWYYDNPAAPEMILLCPATCDHVRVNDLDVEVLVGCSTIVN